LVIIQEAPVYKADILLISSITGIIIKIQGKIEHHDTILPAIEWNQKIKKKIV